MTAAHRRFAATAVVSLVLVTAVGCGGGRAASTSPGPTAATGLPSSQPLPSGKAGSPPVPLPAPSGVDRQDPTAVSKAVITVQWTVDTTIDASQYQAELRSGPFLAPDYLAGLKSIPPVAAPGAQWSQWAQHRAYTTVTARAEHDDQPADSATLARRQWGIIVTPHGRDGWTGSPTTATVFVTMTRADTRSPWLVSAVNVSS
ncbi:hypothetical protein ACFOSC_29725 [Streptantibioticus rubrisoli]|uniref:Uncharacterized protein n=1 Tax=Streptantibioticus rubrisoli TaxID=1387313 RepID=A0ABT1PFY4_9ACTN|nr:hypothetical protein [Streptantibioticus rubrisoli]MCQ4044274.1 hypothetical protein [Streptantibioticus rubrisoli]